MSTFSVSGLASGLDTKTIISQLMQVEGRVKTKLQWSNELHKLRTTAWRELNTRLETLKSAADALLTATTWDPNAVSSSSTGPWSALSGDPSRLSAVVTGTPTAATHAVEVLQLAQAQRSRSTGELSSATSGVRTTGTFHKAGGALVTGTETITSLRTASGGNFTPGNFNTNSRITMNYTVNGVAQSAEFLVNTTANGGNGTTLAQFRDWVATTIGGGASAAWVNGALEVTAAPGTANEVQALSFSAVRANGAAITNFGISSSTTVAASDGGVVTAPETLTITSGSNSWNVALATGDDKQAIVNKINATSGIGVLATLVSGEIELRSTTSGAASGFSVTSSGGLASQLGFTTSQAAQDAQFTIDGAAHSSATNTGITSAISGVTLNLLGTTSTTLTLSQGASGQTPQEAWASSVTSKLEAFVKAYNDVQSYTYQRTRGENRVANPSTLSDYLAGPMARNAEFSRYGTDLRRTLSDAFAGLPAGENLLSSIGVTTQFKVGAEATNGQLSIDTAAFKQALLADPSKVQQLLTNVGAGAGVTSDDGFVRRIREQAFAMTGQLDDKFNYSLDPQTKRIQDQIDAAQRRLDKRQEYYERMFASLETTLGSLQSQGSWLSGQITALMNASSK